MTTHIERVKLEDPLSAAHTNQLVEAANANAEPGIAGGMWASGVHGATAAYLPDVTISVRYFELYATLATGGSASAYIRHWDSDEGDYVTNTDDDPDTEEPVLFTVHDALSEYVGRARSETPTLEEDGYGNGVRGKHGSFGRAVYRSGRWEIDSLQPHAQMVVCNVNEASGFLVTDTGFDVDAAFVILPNSKALLMADVTGAKNERLDWHGDDNAYVVMAWDATDSFWQPIQMECPAAS